MPVAYGVECYLQQHEIPYIVQRNDRVHRYDPTRQVYEPVDAPKVDCYDEIFAEMEDEEGEENNED